MEWFWRGVPTTIKNEIEDYCSVEASNKYVDNDFLRSYQTATEEKLGVQMKNGCVYISAGTAFMPVLEKAINSTYSETFVADNRKSFKNISPKNKYSVSLVGEECSEQFSTIKYEIKYIKIWDGRELGVAKAALTVPLSAEYRLANSGKSLQVLYEIGRMKKKQPHAFGVKLIKVDLNDVEFSNTLINVIPKIFAELASSRLKPDARRKYTVDLKSYEKQLSEPIQQARAKQKIIDERLKRASVRKEQERQALEKVRLEQVERDRAKARKEKMLTINRFRNNLKEGDQSHCGLVIEVRKTVVQIQTLIGPHWLKRDQIYPIGEARCNFVNGVYQEN